MSSQEAGQLQGQEGCPGTLGPVAETQDLAGIPCLSQFSADCAQPHRIQGWTEAQKALGTFREGF